MRTITTDFESKDHEQRIVWSKWAKAGFRGTYLGDTGVGKTRIGVVPIGTFMTRDLTETAMIVVSRERLRDHEWPDEFKKWGYKSILSRVGIECINTAREFKGQHWNTLIVDEVHSCLSPENIKLFENNTFDRILCLSAKVDDPEKLAYLERIAPVIWETPAERALDLGLVAVCSVYNFAVPLSHNEAVEYNKANSTYKWCEDRLGGKYTAFKNASTALKSKESSSEDKQCATMFFKALRKRNDITNNAEFKPIIAKSILDKYPSRKALVFSESIDFVDKLQQMLGDISVSYHSKLTIEEKEWAMKRFGDGRTKQRVILSCKALNEGFNVPECSLGICTAATSKSLTDIQRRGRIIRLKVGKIAIYINLYTPGTQEEKRIRSRTKGQNILWISNLSEIKELE